MQDRCGRSRSAEELGGEISIVGWVEGPLALAQELRGLNRIMTDIVDDPAFVRDLMDFASEVAIVYAAAQIEAGADTIGMSDAAASMIGPRHYRDLVLPWQRRVLQSIRSVIPKSSFASTCAGTLPAHPTNGDPAGRYLRTGLPHEPGRGQSRARPRTCDPGERLDGYGHAQRDAREESRPRPQMPRNLRAYHIVGAGCEVSPLTPPRTSMPWSALRPSTSRDRSASTLL